MKKTYVAVTAIAAMAAALLVASMAYFQVQPSQTASGQLSIIGTDPPTTASGVTDSSIHYNSVSAHKAGSDMSSGWTQISGSGTLDLMASGQATTMATSRVDAGSYDAFRFNVDSCRVVYQGKAFVATVTSATITAQSQGKVLVNPSSSAAAIVDLRTFIQNTGSSSSPEFLFSATAVASQVPPESVDSATLQVGSNLTLSGAWWNDFAANSSNQLTLHGSISANSLALNVRNTGNADAEIQEVIVTPVSASASSSSTLPASLNGSSIFLVSGSSQLQSTTTIQSATLLNGGTRVSSGSQTTLTYEGAISMNFGSGSIHLTGVLAGQEYLITVIGANTYASTYVVAT